MCPQWISGPPAFPPRGTTSLCQTPARAVFFARDSLMTTPFILHGDLRYHRRGGTPAPPDWVSAPPLDPTVPFAASLISLNIELRLSVSAGRNVPEGRVVCAGLHSPGAQHSAWTQGGLHTPCAHVLSLSERTTAPHPRHGTTLQGLSSPSHFLVCPLLSLSLRISSFHLLWLYCVILGVS